MPVGHVGYKPFTNISYLNSIKRVLRTPRLTACDGNKVKKGLKSRRVGHAGYRPFMNISYLNTIRQALRILQRTACDGNKIKKGFKSGEKKIY